MSTFWLALILSLFCAALSDPGSSRLVWKDIGGSITIQCSTSLNGQESLSLLMGLHEDVQLLFFDNYSDQMTVKEEMKHRLEPKGDISKLDIIIRNLTVEDTGVYWCMYKELDKDTNPIVRKGNGSVLLVVKGAAPLGAAQKCPVNVSQPSLLNAPITLVLAFALTAVVLIACIALFIWIIPKIKVWRATMKPMPVTTNDVYEDMRATLRR